MKPWTYPQQRMIYTWALVCPECRKECHFEGMGEDCAYWRCKCGVWTQSWADPKTIMEWKLERNADGGN